MERIRSTNIELRGISTGEKRGEEIFEELTAENTPKLRIPGNYGIVKAKKKIVKALSVSFL